MDFIDEKDYIMRAVKGRGFLLCSNYSREEVFDGMKQIMEKPGYGERIDAILKQ